MSDLVAPNRVASAPPRLRSVAGRWVVAAAVLGSAVVVLDASVVNIAVPRIGSSLGDNVADLQWVVGGYTLALASLILVGGALGDRLGRRTVFIWGSVGFALASLLCSLASSMEMLVAARVVQGIAGALITPGSLALISASIDRRDHGAAIGLWAGFIGVVEAVGPIVGGWLTELAGWRSVFLINVPFAVAVTVVAVRYLPESRDADARPLDLPGAVTAVAGLGALTYGFIGARGWISLLGMALLGVFALIQVRGDHPLLPPALFSSRVFTAANLVTAAVYAGLGGVYFLLPLQLQMVAGYSPLAAGLATVPITGIMLVSSASAGRWAQRHGARIPMILGPALAALGAVLLTEIGPRATYLSAVLPGTIVLGVGLAVFVAPLTGAVFAAVSATESGIASGVNNAVARTAQLLAVAALPGLVGISGARLTDAIAFGSGFRIALLICGALLLTGAVLAATLMPRWSEPPIRRPVG
ncbi:DHA2 family efflux MFS transporter permease subunit [Nocardia vinacea]|uniref:DHA2 family efflux MFS transporter permease subunit n=1 Tax=Nocardia vinacea TaxID=96468 RepID=UPI002E1065AB|nr:DHA2 family efflux MFS transporter permease subunit [Nocardia vinacea]